MIANRSLRRIVAYTSVLSLSGHTSMDKSLSSDELKKLAGYKSVDDFVKSGMIVGLGTGSTAFYAVERLGNKLRSGELKNILCVPTSERTKEQAQSLNIPLATLDTCSTIDVAIDGADDIDINLTLVKGGGGALLREKMIEVQARKFVCIADDSKLSKSLGPNFPIPVEITTFCSEHTRRCIEALPALKGCNARAVMRMGSAGNNKVDGTNIAITDNGNYIVDLHLQQPPADIKRLAAELHQIVGVIEHGIFVNLASIAIIACKDGRIRVACCGSEECPSQSEGKGAERPWW